MKNSLPNFILVYSASLLTILKKNYQNPSSLEQVDVTICNFLESLLKGEFFVDSYSEAVQHLKGISISPSLLQNGNHVGILKSDVPNIGNAGINEASRKADIPKIFSSSSTGMEFILIPAGEFMMGSKESGSEQPPHNVNIKEPFYMGKYPVTQKQWEKVMGDNPSKFEGDDRPVEKVSWNMVQELIKKLNEMEGTDKYRLPSESEWEYACRAGTTTDILLVMMSRNLGIMLGMMKIQVMKLIQLVRSSLIHGVFTTCTVMSGNGFRTDGMITMKVLLLMVVHGKMEIAPPV